MHESCIVSNFYIKSQQLSDRKYTRKCCIVSNFYIKSQRSTTTLVIRMCCIVSNFYIKSQPEHFGCDSKKSCIVSNFYIKSQHLEAGVWSGAVVQYPISTSNHNPKIPLLYNSLLYSIQFLHQITTCGQCEECLKRCIVSNFYIKSQHVNLAYSVQKVVQYPISTSNHNMLISRIVSRRLYSIQFLHQITTREPGYMIDMLLYSIQFLHQITTGAQLSSNGSQLYSIQFLHQITTVQIGYLFGQGLYSIQFLHQITTADYLSKENTTLYSIQFLHQITTQGAGLYD